MRPRRFPKRVVAEIKPTARQPGPRDISAGKPRGKAVRLEGPPVEHAIVSVDIGNKLILNIVPMPSQSPQESRDQTGTPFRSIRAAAIM